MSTSKSFVSTLQNNTGAEVVLGFLPPHGRRLGIGEQITVFGDVREYCARKGARWQQGLAKALKNEDIVILQTPQVHLIDETSKVVQVLRANGGVLGVVDPSWGAFTASTLPTYGAGTSSTDPL